MNPSCAQLDEQQARILLGGELGDVYRGIIAATCAPIYWYRRGDEDLRILGAGTITLAEMPIGVVGITAAHVIRAFQAARKRGPVQLQIMNAVVEEPEIVAISDCYDLATIALPPTVAASMGKQTVPLRVWPPEVPQEGRGIMLAGFPGNDRIQVAPREFNFGLFTVLGVARRVTEEQITWVLEREHAIPHAAIPSPPADYDYGGISGGPVVGWFETKGGLAYPKVCGIVSQAHPGLNNVVAKRTDLIASDGTIRELRG